MNTSGFTEKCIGLKEHINLFDKTAFVSVSDGSLSLAEVEAMLGCLHLLQTDIGKMIYRLNQAKSNLALEEALPPMALDLADL